MPSHVINDEKSFIIAVNWFYEFFYNNFINNWNQTPSQVDFDMIRQASYYSTAIQNMPGRYFCRYSIIMKLKSL